MRLDKNPCQEICQSTGYFVGLFIFRFRIISRIFQGKLSSDKLSQTVILSLTIAGFYTNISFWKGAFLTLGLCFWGLWTYRRIPLALAVDMYEDTGFDFLAEEWARAWKKTIGQQKRSVYKSQILSGIEEKKLLLFGREFPLKNSKRIPSEDLKFLKLSEDLSFFEETLKDGSCAPKYTNLLIGVKELYAYLEEGKELARQAREFEEDPCRVIHEIEQAEERGELSGEKSRS